MSITCPVRGCHVVNREGARFCRRCGEPLGVPQAWPTLADDDDDAAPICDDRPGRPMAPLGHVTEAALREMLDALETFAPDARADILDLLASVPDDGRPVITPPILPMDAD